MGWTEVRWVRDGEKAFGSSIGGGGWARCGGICASRRDIGSGDVPSRRSTRKDRTRRPAAGTAWPRSCPPGPSRRTAVEGGRGDEVSRRDLRVGKPNGGHARRWDPGGRSTPVRPREPRPRWARITYRRRDTHRLHLLLGRRHLPHGTPLTGLQMPREGKFNSQPDPTSWAPPVSDSRDRPTGPRSGLIYARARVSSRVARLRARDLANGAVGSGADEANLLVPKSSSSI